MLPFFVIAGLAFLLRTFWILDMEFKGDERGSVAFIQSLAQHDYSPLAPIAEHSGFAHSSGFYYFVRWVSLGSADPVVMASMIAVLNGLAIAVLWLLSKNSRPGRWVALMCATSFTLVLASRKIWTPDLVAFWVILSMGLLIYSQSNPSSKRTRLALGLSGLCILLSGHMYLNGLSLALSAVGVLGLWFLVKRDWKSLGSWVGGCFLGLLTWVPYIYLLAIHAPGAFSPNPLILQASRQPFQWDTVAETTGVAFTLASPLEIARLYIFHSYAQIKAMADLWILYPLIVLLGVLSVLWIGVYLASLVRIGLLWRKSARNPLIWLSFASVFSTIAGLEIVKLGHTIHYWFGVIPFVYYLIAWACTEDEEKSFARILQRLICVGATLSVLAVFFFFGLVRQTGGFPDEYKTSYRTQLNENRVGGVD